MMFLLYFALYLSAVCEFSVAVPLDVSELEVLPDPEDERRSPGTILEGLTFLDKYAYLEVDPNKDGELPSNEAITDALLTMQRFAGIDETGEFDRPTIQMMRKPRCGLADVVEREEPSRVRRYNVAGVSRYRWLQTQLTYRIDSYPSNSLTTLDVALTNDEVDGIIADAFKEWSDVSSLQFQKSDSPDVDIVLLFGARSHTSTKFDPVFDGAGGTLAHAFTPNSGWGDTNGDVHFDDDETFTHRIYIGTNLFYTATHEIGHSLGLDHSSNIGALMWPYDRGYVPNYKLPADDIAGIQAIYGPKPTEIPISAYCNTTFNAISVINQKLYLFSDTLLWQFSMDGNLLTNPDGEEQRDHFKRLPRRIQSVYERWYDGKVVFLKGDKFYVYDGRVNETPKGGLKIRKGLSSGLPKSITAALHNKQDSTTDFIRGKKVWRLNEISQEVAEGFPKRLGSEMFPELPTRPTAAFLDKFGDAIILKGRDYYKYSITSDGAYRLAADTYPQDFAHDFLNCQMPSAIRN